MHQELYRSPVIQAAETPVLVNKDGRSAGAKSYMWVYRTGKMYDTALQHISATYKIEEELKDLSSEEREKSATGKRFTYCINQEQYLRFFLENGNVTVDNNAAEQSIRSFCIGKANWHLIDTINGAKASAIIYSIAETAKAN